MTELLYLKDMYLKEFTANVVEIAGNKVILDRTAFFIQGSGQSGDSGEINGQKVIETQKGGWHLLQEIPNFKVGDEVSCKIDWDKRYKTMRLHSASHVVEHFIYQLLGKVNYLKTNVNTKRDLTDYQMVLPNPEIQQAIVQKSNEYINQNHAIEINVDNEGIYHWTCGEIQTFCVGTHVKNTSEIGRVDITFEKSDENVTRVIVTLKA
jgi:Ser-tRNA(Ala) deacylase AlaX